ncbi:hypothetical protein ACIA49_37200 [Kribbella sp. NPDC051587]|uniref:effector-associated constant component EACC1 n=1 Tax=Kribbella sp. NPDC051587 TaxID=3364119 RepID=UPI003789E870
MDSVWLVLESADDDPQYVDEQLLHLIDDLREIDLDSVERAADGVAPPGTRAMDAMAVGALVVGLGSSGALLPVLVTVVRDWLLRRRSGSIRLKIGDDEIELTAASDALQQRALEDFLRRHEG